MTPEQRSQIQAYCEAKGFELQACSLQADVLMLRPRSLDKLPEHHVCIELSNDLKELGFRWVAIDLEDE